MQISTLTLAAVLACHAVLVGANADSDLPERVKPLLVKGGWTLPDLPKKEELRLDDLSGCLGAHWDAPRRVKELERLHADLERKSRELADKSNGLAAYRAVLEAEDKANSNAAERIVAEDSALAASRQELEKASKRRPGSKIEAEGLNAKLKAFNERVSRRNREAEALRGMVTTSAAKIDDFNTSIVEFEPIARRFKEEAAEFESRFKSLRDDIAKLEAGCSGHRRLVN